MNNSFKKILLATLIVVFGVVNFSMGDFKVWAADSEDDIRDDIDKIQDKLEDAEKDLQQSQTIYNQKQTQVYSTQSAIQKTEAEISRKEDELNNLNQKINLDKKILESLVREFYFEDQSFPLVRAIFGIIKSNEIYGSFDNLSALKQKILDKIQEVENSKEQIAETKEELAEKKEEHEELLSTQVAERNKVVGEIKETTVTISELRAKLAELQSDLAVLTGESFDAKDIKEAVEFASKKTNVPKNVLYGFLGAETHFNANVGQCTYDKVEEVAMNNYKKLLKISSKWQSSIDTLKKRKSIFEDIVDDLGYSKNKKVSCTPRCDLKISGSSWVCTNGGYIGQGGAMGVAQFMSDVWKYSYESKIRTMTGHSKPNPWDLTDGIMAMAIKIKSAGGTSDSDSAIKKASINYLGYFYQPYYNNIIYWSKHYKDIIN